MKTAAILYWASAALFVVASLIETGVVPAMVVLGFAFLIAAMLRAIAGDRR